MCGNGCRGRRQGWTTRLTGVAIAALALLALIGATPAGAADQGERERLAQLLQAADAGDWPGAGRTAASLGVPQLRAYVRWRELLESTDPPPFQAYQDFLRRDADWPSLGLLQSRAEEAMGDGMAVEDRLAFFDSRPPRTRQGRILAAQALLAVDRRDEAVALLRQSWIGDDFAAGDEGDFIGRYGAYLRPGDHVARLDRLLWDGRTDQARRMLGRVAGPARAVGTARLALQAGAANVDQALAAVPAAVARDPGLLYDRLRWRAARGNDAGVREILLQPPPLLGRPERWWVEQQRAIRSAIADRSFKLAYRLASAANQPPGAARAEAEWLAGWLALRFTGQPQLAGPHFERLWPMVGTPISRARTGYWAGRAAAVRGDRQAAAGWYQRAAAQPHTFYGQLAAGELGLAIADRVAAAPQASANAREALRRRTPARLAGLFCRLGQPDAAQPFLRHLGYATAADPEALAAAVELARACNRANLVLTVTRAAAGNGTYLVRDSFPLPRLPAFQAGGDGLPEPALLLAVARQESLFDPTARSPAGAMGLMQLMPATAQAVTAEQGLPFSRPRLIGDPDYNVRLGALYLARQLERFDQEPALALAAYNAGPGRVAEWLAANGDPRTADRYGLVDWIELIPFAETRNYVQRVLEARGMYRVVLAPPPSPAARVAADAPTPVRPRTKPAS